MTLRLPIYLASLLAPAVLLAQGSTNLIDNSGLDRPVIQDNLWDGVDRNGDLTGFVKLQRENRSFDSVPLVQADGKVVESGSYLPESVNLADLNGDGLPDLVMADPAGYFRVYFNSGTLTEPKFTNSENLPLFLSREFFYRDKVIYRNISEYVRMVPRINLYDWGHRGVQDLIVGNYQGEVLFIPNAGSAKAPEFRQPVSVDAAVIKTSRTGALWGNLYSPLACDWNGDNQADLMVGEGSYSANAIHLLLNQGSSSLPKFSEDARYYLAYGDGREELVPALADYNGDGAQDLLVGDREGRIAVFLNTVEKWKPATELKFSEYVSLGSSNSLGGPITICAADYNGDGLFDLIIGDKDGHVQVAINRGTKGQPKFDAPFRVKGVDVWNGAVNLPGSGPQANPGSGGQNYTSGWTVDSGYRKGNINGFFSVISGSEDSNAGVAADHHLFRAGYFPSQNKIFRPVPVILPGVDDTNLPGERRLGIFDHENGWHAYEASVPALYSASNTYEARYIFKENDLKAGVTYNLSFKVKGINYRDGRWTMAFHGRTKSEQKQIRGERGEVQTIYPDLRTDMTVESGTFAPGMVPAWTTVTKTFQVKFNDRDVSKPERIEAIMAVFDIKFTLEPYTGVLYIDEVQLSEKPADKP